jgi:hypothetical protein
METIGEQIRSLRQEIAACEASMSYGLFLIAVMILALYVAEIFSGKTELLRLILVLVITALFFAAKQDYNISRNAAWIRYAERQMQDYTHQEMESRQVLSWEAWKAKLKSRKYLLPVIDFFAGAVILYVVFASAAQLYQSAPAFVIASCAAIVLGIVAIPLSVVFAGR